MKKFIIAISILIVLYLGFDYLWFREGLYVDLNPDQSVTAFIRTQEDTILLTADGKEQEFFIKGVDVESSLPGKWDTEYAIGKETWLSWFGQIREMGANTIRIYSVYSSEFYDALYEYNTDNPDPLWLLQGTRVEDYLLNTRYTAVDGDFIEQLTENSLVAVDVIHGRKKASLSHDGAYASGDFAKDVSPWVIGYIIGNEWDIETVAYTNETYKDDPRWTSFDGEYLCAKEGSKPFEVVLAKIGNEVMKYESRKYKTQRLISFSNTEFTDPFEYSDEIVEYFQKIDGVDVESIFCSDKVVSGQFASYHAYSYHPDYLQFEEDWSAYGLSKDAFTDETGIVNTYRAYLTALKQHHSMPLVIAEFGTSSGRTVAYRDISSGRDCGALNEDEQGQVLKSCYEDIVASGAVGACVYSWQDGWQKRTANTMHAVNINRSVYWSDAQTAGQFFGLLSFDPGAEESICYVDGDTAEWTDADVVAENGGASVSVKYDEKYIYFRIHKNNLDFENDTFYIPIDTTQKTGSNYAEEYGLKFDRGVDFIVEISGAENSRVLVQERYDALRSTYSELLYKENTYLAGNVPDATSPSFVPINLILEKVTFEDATVPYDFVTQMQNAGRYDVLEKWRLPVTFETGVLRYGDANPENADFDSIADFYHSGDDIELRIPWQMLNFSDPSKMEIHDDYYDGNYGVDYIRIGKMYVGITESSAQRCSLAPVELEGWGNDPAYHERLKESYYIMREIWG